MQKPPQFSAVAAGGPYGLLGRGGRLGLHGTPEVTERAGGTPAPLGFADEAQWEAPLAQVGVVQARHRRIATEGALLGSVLRHGVPADLVIVSDDAGQFNVLRHGLCWVHTERLIHQLIPLNET